MALSLARNCISKLTLYSKTLLPVVQQAIRLQHDNTSDNNTSKCTAVQSDEPLSDLKNPYEREKKVCILCKMNITPDYKNVRLLSQFQSPYTGRIYGRHITGLCKIKQEKLEKEIYKAQYAGLMPTYLKDVAFFKDPKLFDPENPIRQHRF